MPPIYSIAVSGDFSAAHRLPGHPGPCAAMHGHNFQVTAEICAGALVNGMVADFLDVRSAMDAIFADLDHACLNDVQALDPPTAEVLAGYILARLKERLNDGRVRVAAVTVIESRGLAATCREA